jgi:hypothetical protein
MLLAVKQTVSLNEQNFLDPNIPTHIAKVFSNLEIMQYQYPASNQYWKIATEPLRIWLFANSFVKLTDFS